VSRAVRWLEAAEPADPVQGFELLEGHHGAWLLRMRGKKALKERFCSCDSITKNRF
jgi:hypothetical protein